MFKSKIIEVKFVYSFHSPIAGCGNISISDGSCQFMIPHSISSVVAFSLVAPAKTKERDTNKTNKKVIALFIPKSPKVFLFQNSFPFSYHHSGRQYA